MEANGCDSTEYKFNPIASSIENASRHLASSSNINQLQEKSRDRKNAIKRKHSDPRIRERSVQREEISQEEEGKDRYRDGQQLQTVPLQSQGQVSQPQVSQTMPAPATFPNYYYGPTDQFNADPSRRPYTMMPQYSLYPMNQWVNSMESMSSNNMALNPASVIPGSNGMDMPSTSSTMMNNIPPYMMNMPADPSLYGMMGGMGNFCSFPYMNGHENLSMPIPVQKETITLTKSVLYAPNPNAPVPTLRAKPPGCRTVFVGGLPEKITEEIVREAFEQYGEIVTIRMSKKNFCHIRFALEEHVEKALYLSGFRMKIENKDEASYSGRLHVDYAIARDDQYEYECARRAAQRIARHKAIGELESKEASAPAIPLFSEVELQNLLNQFRNGNFKGGVQIMVSWLEKGEVNKRNAGTFFSIIQSLNHHVRRLLNDKSKYEEELKTAKLVLRQKMCGISLQFNDIEKVFETAKYQKVWDHFTKAQRKNIELWKKQTSEIKKANSEELIDERVEDEMDLSDGEEVDSNKDQPKVNEKAKVLREQIEEVRKKLASKLQEVAKAKEERKNAVDSEHQTFLVSSQNLAEIQKKLEKYQALWAAKSGVTKREPIPESEKSSESSCQRVLKPCAPHRTASGTYRISEKDVRLVSLISTFLCVHPFGAHIDYICSYLLKIEPSVVTRDVENLMRLLPTVFQEISTGIGATLEKLWTYKAFTRPS